MAKSIIGVGSVANDGTAFDIYPFEDATSFPGTKDYIVINRASADKNQILS